MPRTAFGYHLLTPLILTLVSWVPAYAERFHRDIMPGRENAEAQHTSFEAELRNMFLYKSNSSDLPEYERITPTLLSSLRIFGNTALTSRLSASSHSYVGLGYAQENEMSSGPTATAESSLLGFGTRSGLTLTTANNLDFGGFMELRGQAAEQTERENAGLQSTRNVDDHVIWRPGVTITKKTGSWNAGGYYDLGASEKIRVQTKVLDDVLDAESFAAMPPRFGGFFETDIGGRLALGTELTFLLGSRSELQAEGAQVYDDSYRASFHLHLPQGGLSSLWISFSHETLAYANQDFIDFDNIPVTDLEVTYTFPSAYFLGALLSYSDDRQSTDEINQDFKLLGVGLRMGWKEPK